LIIVWLVCWIAFLVRNPSFQLAHEPSDHKLSIPICPRSTCNPSTNQAINNNNNDNDNNNSYNDSNSSHHCHMAFPPHSLFNLFVELDVIYDDDEDDEPRRNEKESVCAWERKEASANRSQVSAQ
jgi:hypothetical protein